MSKHASDFAGVPVEPSDENALLRAALAEAQQRISELERGCRERRADAAAQPRRFRAELERVVGLAERHGTPAAVVGIELTASPRSTSATAISPPTPPSSTSPGCSAA